jgi:CheY-like chemotaxis protein
MSDGGRAESRRSLTVLFVDDYPEYVEAGEEYLQTVDERLSVLPETRAAAALDRIESDSVDCVVCDYEMPEMSGLELLAAAREARPGLPFILLTGHELERVDGCVEDGATDVLQKGSGTHTFEALRTRIRELAPADGEVEGGVEAGFHFDNIRG